MRNRIRLLFAGACCLGLIGPATKLATAGAEPEPPELSVPDGEQEREALDATGCSCNPNCFGCLDANPCTIDTCLQCTDAGFCVGGCLHSPAPAGTTCNDGVFCNGADTCSGATCVHAGNPCPGPDGDSDCSETCDESADNCLANDPDGSDCDDVVFCNGADTCSGGLCSVHEGSPCTCEWSALGSGMNNWVNALAVFDDGSGEALYAGGGFTSAGGAGASHIAKWNGSSWSALGSGINGEVNALAVHDDGSGPALYAGGDFTAAGGAFAISIARWNGSSWSEVGDGLGFEPDESVSALTVFDDGFGLDLYAGGLITLSNFVFRWNGSRWQNLPGSFNGPVLALTSFDDGFGPDLYAGGSMTGAIWRWEGDFDWSALGSGMNNDVFALRVFDDGGGPALYAGGRFTTAGGVSANHIAKWNGSSWSVLGSGLDTGASHGVYALTVFDDGGGPALYAGGDFFTAGGASATRIAGWNGASWSALGSGINNTVSALTVFDDGGGEALYAGGFFTSAGGVSANRIARWTCGTPCPADINNDGVVNASDLALLLGAWGPNPGHPADINGDGTVNPKDLAMLLGSWGECV